MNSDWASGMARRVALLDAERLDAERLDAELLDQLPAGSYPRDFEFKVIREKEVSIEDGLLRLAEIKVIVTRKEPSMPPPVLIWRWLCRLARRVRVRREYKGVGARPCQPPQVQTQSRTGPPRPRPRPNPRPKDGRESLRSEAE